MRRSLPVVTDAECKGCGACCRHMGYPSFIRYKPTDPDYALWQELPVRLKHEVMVGWERGEKLMFALQAAGVESFGALADYGPCIWLQADGTCKHYDQRPWVCREFEVGGDDCLNWRRRRGIDDGRRRGSR